MRSWVTIGPRPDGSYGPLIDPTLIEPAIAKLATEIERAPKSASFLTGKDGKVVGVVAGKPGLTLDAAATAQRVRDALLARTLPYAQTDLPVALAFTEVDPAMTTAEAEQLAPLMTRVSTWTTNYEVSERNGFAANITIPARVIDGTVVAPGEVFDFWKVVGIPTYEAGYRDGGAIINGRTSPTGALGGGICSCSTTLFNAAVRAGYEILEREAHYYYISRYPVGLDATVYITGGTTRSVRFRNDTDYPILIRGYASPGKVRFDFYSVPSGRTVEFSEPIIKNYRAASDLTEYTTSLKPGQSKRLEYPTAGFESWVTRTVRDKNGTVIREDTFYSRYARVNGLTLIGKKAEASPSPEPSPEPSAEPPAEPTPAP